MAMKDALLPEFDHEMANTRKCLERIPDDRLDWRPHAKSSTFLALGTHLAKVPLFGAQIAGTVTVDMPGAAGPEWATTCHSRADILAMFDRNVAAARSAIAGLDDGAMMTTWSFLWNGQPVMQVPRVAALRTFLFSHLIHHRGQFTMYLRLNDIPMPGMYGPSADEKM
jgi:uncharacterized damage-inducible protein DinB